MEGLPKQTWDCAFSVGWEDWDRIVPRNLGLVFMLDKWRCHATFHFTWAMSAVILMFRVWQFVVIFLVVWFIHNYFLLVFQQFLLKNLLIFPSIWSRTGGVFGPLIGHVQTLIVARHLIPNLGWCYIRRKAKTWE